MRRRIPAFVSTQGRNRRAKTLTTARPASAVRQGKMSNAHESLRLSPSQTSRPGADLAVRSAHTPPMVHGSAMAHQNGAPIRCKDGYHRASRTRTSPGSGTSSWRTVPSPATTSGSTCPESAPFCTTRRSVTCRSHRPDVFFSEPHPRRELDGHRFCINSGNDPGPPTVKSQSFLKRGSAQSSSEAKRLFRDSAKVGWAKTPSRRAW
jgi:hypothetical protein